MSAPESRPGMMLSTLKALAPFALGTRHLAHAHPRGADPRSLAPLRHLRRRHLRRHRECLPAADLGLAGRRHRGAEQHARPGQGLRRFCQPQRAAGRGGLPRRAGRGQVRAGPAHQPEGRVAVRQVHAGPGLQHLHHRRADRPRLPEQHRARRRALPDHPGTGPEQRLGARGRGQTAPRRLPDVLRHGQPGHFLGAVAHRHVGEPDRRLAGGRARAEGRFRQMAAGGLGPGAGGHCRAAPADLLGVPARRDRYPRSARGRAPATARDGSACRATSGSPP